MTQEIERKFLVDTSKILVISGFNGEMSIRQWYLDYDGDRVIRLRVTAPKAPFASTMYHLTFKGKGQLVRPEIELTITAEEYQALLELYKPTLVVQKTRYRIFPDPTDDSLVYELDVFPNGEMLVEVELDSEDQVFEVPSWFGKEVTNDLAYNNLNIARNGFPTQNNP